MSLDRQQQSQTRMASEIYLNNDTDRNRIWCDHLCSQGFWVCDRTNNGDEAARPSGGPGTPLARAFTFHLSTSLQQINRLSPSNLREKYRCCQMLWPSKGTRGRVTLPRVQYCCVCDTAMCPHTGLGTRTTQCWISLSSCVKQDLRRK